MSVIAAAIVGSAVVGAYSAIKAGDKAAGAVKEGAATAADATVQSTEMQIAEIGRQFDYQQGLLRPFVQSQLGARERFNEILGIGAPQAQLPPVPGTQAPAGAPAARPGQDARFEARGRQPPFAGAPPPTSGVTIDGTTGQVIDGVPAGNNYFQNATEGGFFRDPNLDTRTLAPGTPGQDVAVRRADDVRLAAPGGFQQDPRFQFAQGTEIVGQDFETSPGFEFSMEQAMREVERRRSAGGNYGGRAVQEATRRAQGEAGREYYNWVGARGADLSRQDQAIAAYQGRERTDVARGDIALESYLGRSGTDLQRGDQAYYNYLSTVGAGAGLNVGAPQAVGSSQSASAGIAGAYAQQGTSLSDIYTGQGQDLATIGAGQVAGVGQAVQGGIQNYLTGRIAGIPMGF